jgi:diguanylate cyclase (GGDEF)-like protein
VGYSFLQLQDEYVTGGWTDVAYSLAYVVIGLAGYLELIMARRRQIASRQQNETPMWVQVMPYGWVVLAYWILVVTMYEQTTLSKTRAAMFVGLITLFVVLRQVLSLHDNRALSQYLSRLLQQVKEQASDLEQANREMHIEILERRRMAERLSYDAMHDGLTGLPNRALFLDRLTQAARKKQRQPGLLYSVMFLDLDGFKLVNDSLGHVLGDRLLMRVAGILRGCVRATDTVARLGGDEFVILVEDVSHSRSVVEMANRVQSELRQPIDLEGTPVYITTSIGIVTTVNDYDRPEDLLRDADLAMYHAKSLGKARYAIFNPAMRTVAVTRLAMENELRAAIEQGEFFLEYQPVFDLASRQPVGFEALLRWNHPEQGRLEPGAFVSVAEDAGLLLPIGRWCLYEACRQARAWPAAGRGKHFGQAVPRS